MIGLLLQAVERDICYLNNLMTWSQWTVVFMSYCHSNEIQRKNGYFTQRKLKPLNIYSIIVNTITIEDKTTIISNSFAFEPKLVQNIVNKNDKMIESTEFQYNCFGTVCILIMQILNLWNIERMEIDMVH